MRNQFVENPGGKLRRRPKKKGGNYERRHEERDDFMEGGRTPSNHRRTRQQTKLELRQIVGGNADDIDQDQED